MEKSGKQYIKLNGSQHPLFIDLPRCTANRGVFKSQFGKEGKPSMDMALIFRHNNPEHVAFIDFMTRLTKHVRDQMDSTGLPFCHPMKLSTYRADEHVMYSKVDSASEGDGQLRMVATLIDVSPVSLMRSSFETEVTLKISGVCKTSNGDTFMRRITSIAYKGPPQAEGILVDASSNELVFDVTNSAKMSTGRGSVVYTNAEDTPKHEAYRDTHPETEVERIETTQIGGKRSYPDSDIAYQDRRVHKGT